MHTLYIHIDLYLSMVVEYNPPPSPTGLCHDAVSGWKGLTPPNHPHPGHHVAQSGTGCCWIQCHPVPQPCMMTPPLRFPFHLSTPDPDLWHWEPIAGAICRVPGPLILDHPDWLLSRTTAHLTAERSALHTKQGHCPCRTQPSPSPRKTPTDREQNVPLRP